MVKKTKKRKQNTTLFWKKVGMFLTVFIIFVVISVLLLGVKSLITFDSVSLTSQTDETNNQSLIIKDALLLENGKSLPVQVSVYNTANTHAQNVQFSLTNCSTENISISSSMIESITPRESKVAEVTFESTAQAGDYVCTFEARKDPFAQTIVTQQISIQVTE